MMTPRVSAPFSAALIGVGGYGSYHLKQLRALEAEGRLRLVAVADPFLDGEPLAQTRAELVASGVRIYPDFRELCAREQDLGLVSIVSPIPLHEAMVEAALGTGACIYLEKPPVPTLQQWTRLVALDQRERVTVGFQMLALEGLLTLRRWMEAGELGAVQRISFGGLWPRDSKYFARARWAGKLMLDGEPVFDGPATNAMSHHVNSVMFLGAAGTPEVCAVPRWVAGEFYRARPDLESYDLASLSGEFVNGVRFAGAVGHCSAEILPYEIRVEGTRGAAWLAEDGCWLGSNCGLPEWRDPASGEQAVAAFYRETAAWVAGERARPIISLRDTGAFLRTVNAGLISSGVIHPVPAAEVERTGNDPTVTYTASVRGIVPAVRAVVANCQPLSAFTLPWAVAGVPVEPSKVLELHLGGGSFSGP